MAKFKVHNMYNKSGRTKVAQTMAQHTALKKQGIQIQSLRRKSNGRKN